MLSVNANVTSLITQNHLTKSNNSLQRSLERLSTGCKINRASDDAANLAVSKSMECQVSGTTVAQDNTQQAINLVQTADSALGEMQNITQRIRELGLQSMNGTYSDSERAMMQGEVEQLTKEIYQQKNNAHFNNIAIFGKDEYAPATPVTSDPSVILSDSEGSPADAILRSAQNDVSTSTVGAFDPTHAITTDEEATAAGYIAIHNAAEFANIKNGLNKKYCLMGDIDFSQVSNWGNVTTQSGFELNGNGYAIKNFVIDYYGSTNPDMHALFYNISSGSTVKNLNMENVDIYSFTDSVAGLSCECYGTLDNCTVSGRIESINRVAGLVANAYGTITSCSSSGSVTGTGKYTGGLVGFTNYGTITSCSSSGSVTGNGENTGGLVGSADSTSITSCKSSGNVTGNDKTGGFLGYAYHTTVSLCSASVIVNGHDNVGGFAGEFNECNCDKIYTMGSVNGNDNIGGLAGQNYCVLSDSYSMCDVTGNDKVGGAFGANVSTINRTYSTGTVKGNTNVGGFVGDSRNGSINNCYTTSEANFYGNNLLGTIENCYSASTTKQDGVENHDAKWFNDGKNLTFLGDAFDTKIIPPDIIGNERPPEKGIQFQIGANSGKDNTLNIETEFSLNGFFADVSTREKAEETVKKVDDLLNQISTMRSNQGATQNRLESVMQSLTTKENNMSSSLSTIVDTDFAFESESLVKSQILQNVTSALLAQANTNPSIALKLL